MTERDMLLRAVLEDPGDDTVRLVYADWLEENGDSERAEFIRVQCELTRLTLRLKQHGFSDAKDIDWFSRLERLRTRGRELLSASYRTDWFELCHVCPWPGGRDDLVWAAGKGTDVRTYFGGKVGRGFVAEVSATTNLFTEEVARELFSKHPVTKVALNDREPLNLTSNPDGSVCWFRDTPHYVNPPHSPPAQATIPAHLFDLMAASNRLGNLHPRQLRYRNAADALAHLSGVCCLWGRSLVKPPLRDRQLSGHTTSTPP